MELDHVFVCTASAEAAIEALTASGLELTPRRVHRGQGTANTCAFFDNAYLEILWGHDDAELRSPLVQPLGLWERVHWRDTGACPFGIAIRLDADEASPFETWAYEPPYIPAGASIPIGTPEREIDEPLVFVSPAALPPEAWPKDKRPPLIQRGNRRALSGVTLTLPAGRGPSRALRALSDAGVMSLERGSAYHLEVQWDGGTAGGSLQFRGALPLSITW